MGAKGILTQNEINTMIEKARGHGALVSCRAGGNGEEEPYEINTTWYGALNAEGDNETLEIKVKRFVASRSIALALRGIPGIYFHGLIGTGNDPSVVEKSGIRRDINRVPIDEKALLSDAKDFDSKLMQIVVRLLKLMELRTQTYAFHPNVPQRILKLSPQVFALIRTPDRGKPVLAITNISNRRCELNIRQEVLGIDTLKWRNLIENTTTNTENGTLFLNLQPYDAAWMIPES